MSRRISMANVRRRFEVLENRSLLAIVAVGPLLEVDVSATDNLPEELYERDWSTGEALRPYWPQVAMNSEGAFAVSWTEQLVATNGVGETSLYAPDGYVYTRLYGPSGDQNTLFSAPINVLSRGTYPLPVAGISKKYSRSGVGLGEAGIGGSLPMATFSEDYDPTFSDQDPTSEVTTHRLIARVGPMAAPIEPSPWDSPDDPETFKTDERVAFSQPAVAMDESGNVFLAYERIDAESLSRRLFVEGYDSTWVPLFEPIEVFNLDSLGGHAGPIPQIACDADGDMIVVHADPESAAHKAVRISKEGDLGTPFTVMTLGTYPQVAIDDDGDAVFVWGEGNTVKGVRQARDPLDVLGGTLGTPFIVDSEEAPWGLIFPDVAMNGAGDFVVAWTA